MTDEPRLEDRAEQPCVSIRTEANFTEWGGVNALIPEVQDWLAARDLTPAGPPLYRYHRIGNLTDRFDVEVGFPVAAPVAGDDRVRSGGCRPGAAWCWTIAATRTRSPGRTVRWSPGPTPTTSSSPAALIGGAGG